MRERLLALTERRVRLTARAQVERESLAGLLAPADSAAAAVAALFGIARRAAEAAGRYPLITVAVVALLVALRPRRALAWLARGWSLWRLYRVAQGWWQRFSIVLDARPGARAPQPGGQR